MTIPPSAKKAFDVLAAIVSFVASACSIVILSLFLLMPVGNLVWDYWAPKVMSLLQPAPTKVVTKGNK